MRNADSTEKFSATGWGLIAGNGRFPFLVLESARHQGIAMAVIAIKEEASPDLANLTQRIHWVSLGELSKTIDLLHQEGVTQAVMAGQVKHNKIFSAIRPDWKLAKLLVSLPKKNTDSLIGAIATLFLQPLLPEVGVLTQRSPDAREAADISYGLALARQIAAMDIGQTIVVSDSACVAVEAMEGTDETISRAARLAAGKPLAVIKVSKPAQDMRFDVPVIGLSTVEQMKAAGATVLAIDAGRTLLFDRAKLIEFADAAKIAIQAFAPVALAEINSVEATPVEPKSATLGTNKK